MVRGHSPAVGAPCSLCPAPELALGALGPLTTTAAHGAAVEGCSAVVVVRARTQDPVCCRVQIHKLRLVRSMEASLEYSSCCPTEILPNVAERIGLVGR